MTALRQTSGINCNNNNVKRYLDSGQQTSLNCVFLAFYKCYTIRKYVAYILSVSISIDQSNVYILVGKKTINVLTDQLMNQLIIHYGSIL